MGGVVKNNYFTSLFSFIRGRKREIDNRGGMNEWERKEENERDRQEMRKKDNYREREGLRFLKKREGFKKMWDQNMEIIIKKYCAFFLLSNPSKIIIYLSI